MVIKRELYRRLTVASGRVDVVEISKDGVIDAR